MKSSMSNEISIRQLTESNSADYELLTKHGDDGKICYCSFWHQKWASMDEYHKVQKENPERLKACVMDRVKSNFHVGVIAYENEVPCAWVSVGPLIDFYWTWRRVAQVGETAKTVAGIMCFTAAPEFRGTGVQTRVLDALKNYGKQIGWSSIEAYPFANQIIEKHPNLKWTGVSNSYEMAGFKLMGNHWLSCPDFERHLYKLDLS